MANQIIGVLREVLAIRDGRQYPHLDTRFTAQRSTFGTKHLLFRTDQLIDGIERSVETTAPEVVAALPTPLTDPNDPGASLLSAASLTEPGEVLDTLKAALKQPDMSASTEIPLTIVRAQLDLGMTTEAVLTLRDMDDRLQRDWRHQWLSGVSNLSDQ
jgi:serine/threonine-protein kinase PknG